MSYLDYKQPEFYHFSRDSIELAHYAAKYFYNKKNLSVLDLGCGSGVVGIEFCLHHVSVGSIDFIEKQREKITKNMLRNLIMNMLHMLSINAIKNLKLKSVNLNQLRKKLAKRN